MEPGGCENNNLLLFYNLFQYIEKCTDFFLWPDDEKVQLESFRERDLLVDVSVLPESQIGKSCQILGNRGAAHYSLRRRALG